jgi:hypothetical protein
MNTFSYCLRVLWGNSTWTLFVRGDKSPKAWETWRKKHSYSQRLQVLVTNSQRVAKSWPAIGQYPIGTFRRGSSFVFAQCIVHCRQSPKSFQGSLTIFKRLVFCDCSGVIMDSRTAKVSSMHSSTCCNDVEIVAHKLRLASSPPRTLDFLYIQILYLVI